MDQLRHFRIRSNYLRVGRRTDGPQCAGFGPYAGRCGRVAQPGKVHCAVCDRRRQESVGNGLKAALHSVRKIQNKGG